MRIVKLKAAEICEGNRWCDCKVSRCLVDAGLLSPDLERLRTNAPVAGCGHEMAPWFDLADRQDIEPRAGR